MAYLVGTDEAGYGPNLGPLVISVSVWETPEQVGVSQLFDRLGHAIGQRPDGQRVAMADSKQLYAPGKGLRHLERGLWAALGLLGHRPRTWQEMWRAFTPEGAMPQVPWLAGYDEPAPVDCRVDEIEPAVETLRAGLESAQVRLVALRSRAVFEEEFNDLIDRCGSKGAALSHATLDLAAGAIGRLPPEGRIEMVCDKHGGRNRYGELLSRHFPGHLIEVRGESRARSVYRFGPSERRIEARFLAKAESCLPAALASMASKYLRELAMRALNAFWLARVPGLRPTAGYPQDAKRFRADLAETLAKLQIADRAFWRTV